MEPITLKYSEQYVRDAVRLYWRRTIGLVYPVVSLLLAVFVIYQVMNGERSWFVGVVGAVAAISIAVIIAVYFVNLSRSLGRFRRMKDPVATLELGQERFKIVSDVGTSEISWALIKQLLCFEHIWLVLFSSSEYITLPVDDLSEQEKQFIIDQMKENGVKITY